jgi:transposase
LPEGHLAFFVSDLVDQLDLSAITTVYEDEERGYPPYHPVMLTKALVYAYCVGVFSSRRIQRRLVEDVAFRVLAAGNEPDFRTIADFRKTHLTALRGFFEQVLRLARELGAPRVGRVALDSSKIKANASKHKAMSYGRMREKPRQLREEVKELLAQAEAADAAEDADYGSDRRGNELPADLQRRESAFGIALVAVPQRRLFVGLSQVRLRVTPMSLQNVRALAELPRLAQESRLMLALSSRRPVPAIAIWIRPPNCIAKAAARFRALELL